MFSSEFAEGVGIVVIDDDQLVRDFAVHTIAFSTNQKVTTFDSGFHAWHFIQSNPDMVDLIIADANIPDISGMELLERLKKGFPQKTFTVTSSTPSHEKAAHQMGADAFLSKPYDVKDLMTLLEKLFAA